MRVKFFKYLDFISISAYYKMLPGRHGPSPSLARTRTMFEVRLKKLENWRKRAGLEKMNVLVAEVGWQSKGNGVVYRQPWNWRARGRVDFWDQVCQKHTFAKFYYMWRSPLLYIASY